MGEHALPTAAAAEAVAVWRDRGVYSGREIARRLRWDLASATWRGLSRTFARSIVWVLHREDSRRYFARRCGRRGPRVREAGPGGDRREQDPGEHSRHKAMSHARMKEAEEQLEDEIAQILAQMDELQ